MIRLLANQRNIKIDVRASKHQGTKAVEPESKMPA
jgi:hypothetical protein